MARLTHTADILHITETGRWNFPAFSLIVFDNCSAQCYTACVVFKNRGKCRDLFIKDAVSLVHKNASGRFKIECQPKVLAECELQFMYWLVTSTAGWGFWVFFFFSLFLFSFFFFDFWNTCISVFTRVLHINLQMIKWFLFFFFKVKRQSYCLDMVCMHIQILYTHMHTYKMEGVSAVRTRLAFRADDENQQT